jgi:LPXTG-site transpeptidase (sortase) family protein
MQNSNSRLLKIILKSAIALIVIFVVVYIFFSGESLYRLIKQKLFPDASRNTTLENLAQDKNAEKEEYYRLFKDNWLYLPRLGIEAPVQWNVPQNQANDLLPLGLVHISDSATPDQNGDVIISGHSSYYWWVKGDYKTVFAPLTEVKIGDAVILRKDKVYIYEVEEIKEIGGDEPLDFATKGQDKGKLYLATCVPIGTDLRRLIVTAKFIREI